MPSHNAKPQAYVPEQRLSTFQMDVVGASAQGARRRSWSEVRQALKEIRLNAAIVPRNVGDVQFRVLSNNRVRLYFISSPSPGKGNTIMSADVSISDDSSVSPGVANIQVRFVRYLRKSRVVTCKISIFYSAVVAVVRSIFPVHAECNEVH